MQIKRKELDNSHLAYDEMFLYANVLVIKMFKGSEKAWNREHQGLPREYLSMEEQPSGFL